MDRGLLRSIVLEGLFFVPASAVLLILLGPLLLPISEESHATRSTAIYAAIGVASYGFPFATLRRIVTQVALNSLREFANLTPKEVGVDSERRHGEQS